MRILCGVILKTPAASPQNVSFVKGVPDIESPENITRFIVLDDLMDTF